MFSVTGCKKQQPARTQQEEIHPAVPPKPASSTSSQPALVQAATAAPAYQTDPIYQQAHALADKDIRKAMGMLEGAIAKAPDDPHSAP